jgi:hypothetical protein
VFWGMKWCANENGIPSSAASLALKSLEPRSQIAGVFPAPGTAVIRGNVPRKNAKSSASWTGRSSAEGSADRRSACAVIWSVPGARPTPRSIRPGWSASSIPNCSATTSGWWFGSITPPEPTRIVVVTLARCAISTAGAELAMPGSCGAPRPSAGDSPSARRAAPNRASYGERRRPSLRSRPERGRGQKAEQSRPRASARVSQPTPWPSVSRATSACRIATAHPRQPRSTQGF